MKIRYGFVSNSSSSSFLIYGAQIPDEKLEGEDGYEVMQELADKAGLRFFNLGSDFNTYLGLSWDSIKDDETGSQFKARVEARVRATLGDDASCDTHQEVTYNG